mgnify:CR=1 FL=1
MDLDADDLRFTSTGIVFTNDTAYNIGFQHLPHGTYQLSMKKTSGNADSYYFTIFSINGTNNFHTLTGQEDGITYGGTTYDVDAVFNSSIEPHLQVNTTGTHEYSIIKLT